MAQKISSRRGELVYTSITTSENTSAGGVLQWKFIALISIKLLTDDRAE